MGTVTIRCPRTDRAVSTKIETEEQDFKRLPDVPARLSCPACGEVHIWTRRDAWLSQSQSEGQPAAVPLVPIGQKP